jgi:hypothetical protein
LADDDRPLPPLPTAGSDFLQPLLDALLEAIMHSLFFLFPLGTPTQKK